MKRILNYIPTILAAGLIMYLSLLREPHFQLPEISIAYLDKWVHGLMYMVLGIVFTFDLRRDGVRLPTAALPAIVLPSLYGGLIEILQEYCFAPRTGEWLDWAADIAGVMVGAGATLYILYKRKKI
ncbi:MAG: VanZ family protein [Paludibacteraceae bacterium]|nr:VanZ family protein [Paludibacteraceae bacterium]